MRKKKGNLIKFLIESLHLIWQEMNKDHRSANWVAIFGNTEEVIKYENEMKDVFHKISSKCIQEIFFFF